MSLIYLLCLFFKVISSFPFFIGKMHFQGVPSFLPRDTCIVQWTLVCYAKLANSLWFWSLGIHFQRSLCCSYRKGFWNFLQTPYCCKYGFTFHTADFHSCCPMVHELLLPHLHQNSSRWSSVVGQSCKQSTARKVFYKWNRKGTLANLDHSCSASQFVLHSFLTCWLIHYQVWALTILRRGRIDLEISSFP